MDDQNLFTSMLEEFRIKNREKQELIIKKNKNKTIFIKKEFYDKIYSLLNKLKNKFRLEL